MTYLNYPETVLKERSAIHTAREIAGQPALWQETANLFFGQSNAIRTFLQSASQEATSIILTGAGTSAFIGLSLAGPFFKQTGILTQAIATTDLVSHPQYYFDDNQIPLIISFARSGNSPESCAALELADSWCRKCFHLIITCNESGSLANYQSPHPVYSFVLPADANDKSLAMTGSYSAMLLTGLLLAYAEQPAHSRAQLALLIQSARQVLDTETTALQRIAELPFQRAVFLGSGPLAGTATEAALKLQELTDGKIISKADSYLGFRHGPKAVIDSNTLIVYFFSNNPYVQQYEADLLPAMKTGTRALYSLAIAEKSLHTKELQQEISLGQHHHTPGSQEQTDIAEDFLPVCSIIPAQLLSFYKSLHLNLQPDNPSVSGAISRVVQGVTIYPGPEYLKTKNLTL